MAADPPEDSGARRGAADASASALVRPAARVAAFGVFLLAVGALAWMHRDDIFPPEAVPADDPVAFCVAERWAGIDEMMADGTVDTARSIRPAPSSSRPAPRRCAKPSSARAGGHPRRRGNNA